MGSLALPPRALRSTLLGVTLQGLLRSRLLVNLPAPAPLPSPPDRVHDHLHPRATL